MVLCPLLPSPLVPHEERAGDPRLAPCTLGPHQAKTQGITMSCSVRGPAAGPPGTGGSLTQRPRHQAGALFGGNVRYTGTAMRMLTEPSVPRSGRTGRSAGWGREPRTARLREHGPKAAGLGGESLREAELSCWR